MGLPPPPSGPAPRRPLKKPYNPLKKFKRQDLVDELDFLMAEQLNRVVRGELDSEQARSAYFALLRGRFRKRARLKHRVRFQRRLLIALIGGVPKPLPEDMEMVIDYLRRRVLRGSLSLAEARERLDKATHLLDDTERDRWATALDGGLLG